jgi:outer membrane lipoprotein SlyB
MEHTVYAIFDSEGAAHEAADELVREGVPSEVIDVHLQSGELTVEDLTQPETASRRYVKVGVPLVVLVGAIAGAVISGLTGALVGVLVATVFGTIAAGLSGSIEPQRELAALAPDMDEGRTMLVVDVTNREAAVDYERVLRRRGAVRVGST